VRPATRLIALTWVGLAAWAAQNVWAGIAVAVVAAACDVGMTHAAAKRG
jgi:hypothetical protein